MRGGVLVALALCGSCGDAAREPQRAPVASSPAGAASAPATPAPSAAPAPVCACSGAETCIDGGCVVLPEGLSADALLGPGRLGLWNAWSTIAPLTRGAVEKLTGPALDLSEIGGERAARPTCAKDGFVPGRDRKGGERWSVHLATVIASRDVEAELWGSAVGELEVRIGESAPVRFAEVRGGGGRALLDEGAARVRLERGATPIAVFHERPETRRGGFYLRLRDPAGGFARGIRVVPRVPGARCAPHELLDARAELTPLAGEDGAAWLEVAMRPSFEGLAPPREAPLILEASTSRPDAVAIRSSALPWEEVARGERSTSVRVPALAKGTGTVAIRIAGTPETVASLPTRAFPKELHARVARAAVAAEALPPGATRDALSHHAGVLSRAVGAAERDAAWLEEHTKRAEQLLAEAARGGDPYRAARGLVFRAYRSPLDGQLQPYVAFVPPSIDRRGPLPLVLVAHGMDRLPEHALRTLVGQPPDEHMTLDWAAKHLPRFADQGAILVAPWQLGNAGPHALGDAELAHVIEDVSATWPVDPRRVSLTGYSLGGTVSFVAPMHAPDRFAAAAPLCGYPNLMDYQSVRSVPKQPWEPALLATEYVVNLAENGLHLPMRVVHGGKDVPGRSKVFVDRYRELGQKVVWDLDEEADHDVWTDAYEDGKMIAWLARHQRPAAPRRVRLVTGELRVDRAFWLRVLGLEGYGSTSLASIDATFDPEAKTLSATTRGVSSFEVVRERLPDAGGAPVDPGAVKVTVDGRDLGEIAADQPLVFAREGGAPRHAPGARDRTGKKRHGVSGPIEDALFHPQIVVRGTAAPALVEANRLVADHVATAFGTAELALPVLTDEEATEERLRGRSVVLVGGPASSALASRWSAELPVRFEGDAIVVRGQRFEGPDLAVSAIGPRPGDPDRYVVLHAGTTERATLSIRSLPRYLPDWVVYDASIAAERGGLLFGERTPRGGGFFDETFR